MSKRTTFTTITPLPAGVSRQTVLDFLHNHLEMIDLNPLIKERHPISAPAHAPADERNCAWYSLTDEINYMPGLAAASSDVSYTCAFHDLPVGLQTHCYAPMGLDIRDRWSVGGTLPGEPPERRELGLDAPSTGLYLREDVDMRCNIIMTSFVKKTLKKSHGQLVDKLKEKAAAYDQHEQQQRGRQPWSPNQPQQSQHQHQHQQQAWHGDHSRSNSTPSRHAEQDYSYNGGGPSFPYSHSTIAQGNGSGQDHYGHLPRRDQQGSGPRPSRHHRPSESAASWHSAAALTTGTTASDHSTPDHLSHQDAAVPAPLRLPDQAARSTSPGQGGRGLGLLFDRDSEGGVAWQNLTTKQQQQHQKQLEKEHQRSRSRSRSRSHSQQHKEPPFYQQHPNNHPHPLRQHPQQQSSTRRPNAFETPYQEPMPVELDAPHYPSSQAYSDLAASNPYDSATPDTPYNSQGPHGLDLPVTGQRDPYRHQ